MPDEDDPLALLKVFEHEPIRGSAVAFGAVDDRSIPLAWAGRCDVHFDDTYGADLPFSVTCRAEFKAFLCGRLTERQGREQLGRFCDDSEFVFARDEHGVSTLVPRPSP